VTGIYCYTPEVFDIIKTLEPSGRGELEITDVNNHFVSAGLMAYDVLDGFWGDAGESIDAYYAVNDFVRAHGANKTEPHPPPRRVSVVGGDGATEGVRSAIGEEPAAGELLADRQGDPGPVEPE